MKILNGVKSFLKLYFPHTLLLGCIALLLMWFSDQRYREGEQSADERMSQLENQVNVQTQIIQNGINSAADRISTDTGNQLADIDTTGTNTTTIIEREVSNNSKMADPDLGMSNDMLAAVNKARSETNR